MSSLALGESLEFQGVISRPQLERALIRQRRHGGRLGTCLLEIQAISEPRLLVAISQGLGIPAADIDKLSQAPPSVRALIPGSTAIRQRVIPFEVEKSRLKVAFLDPVDLAARDEIAFATGKRIEVYVALESRIYEALDKFYGGECPERMNRLLDQLNRARFLWNEEGTSSAPTREPRPLAAAKAAKSGRSGKADRILRPQPGRFQSDTQGNSGAPNAPSLALVDDSLPAAETPPPVGDKVPIIAPTKNELAELYSDEALVDPESFLPVALDAALEKARSANEIGSALLNYLKASFNHVALFIPHAQGFKGWMIAGRDANQDRFSLFYDNLEEPSLFATGKQDGQIFVGLLERSSPHRQLVDCWDGDWPMECLFVPIQVGGRTLCCIYADRNVKSPRPKPRAEWKTLVAKTAKAFESCILRNRTQSSSQVESV